LRPDVIVKDFAMPNLNGADSVQRILADDPNARIVVLSMHTDLIYDEQALRAGAAAFVVKQSAPEELIDALHAVQRGGTWLSPAVAGAVVSDWTRRSRNDAAVPRAALLSSREREVLQLVTEGHVTKQIARRLHVSTKTVESHRQNIMGKLGLHSVAELTKYAIRNGITSVGD
jgi:DNA-binding NarL/FixJ family response regulator